MKILAERLCALRDEQNISREKVAAVVGIAARTYQRYENDERDPDAPVIVALADLYKVSTDYLLGRKDERN